MPACLKAMHSLAFKDRSLQNVPRGSPPMYFPNGFKLADAKVCAALVDIAYDQYNQWQKAGNPPSSNFNWDKPSNGDSCSAPLFSTFIYYDIFGYKYVATEPFGFVAVDGNGNAYLAFRGTMPTAADGYADATIDQTDYEIVANYGLVQEGYYFIYQGFDSSISQAIANLSSSKPFQRFFLTGHSLGCGLSTLAVPDVLANTLRLAGKNSSDALQFREPARRGRHDRADPEIPGEVE